MQNRNAENGADQRFEVYRVGRTMTQTGSSIANRNFRTARMVWTTDSSG